MLELKDFVNRPEFEEIRKRICENGVEQPFFDKEAKWGGYCLEQNSYDFAALLVFLKDRFPKGMRTYAEIGTAGGGFIRSIYEFVGFQTGVSVDNGQWRADVWPTNREAIKSILVRYTGDSHSVDCEAWLKRNLQDDVDLFFIDGDHSYDGVIQDMQLVKRLLPSGTLIGFHDLYCSRVPGVGQAFNKFVVGEKWFKIHAILCNFNHENPMGVAICEVP